MHIEWIHGIGRIFDQGLSFENHDAFFSVFNIEKIGPDCVLVSADLSQRKLHKSDVEKLANVCRVADEKVGY